MQAAPGELREKRIHSVALALGPVTNVLLGREAEEEGLFLRGHVPGAGFPMPDLEARQRLRGPGSQFPGKTTRQMWEMG